MREPLKTVDSKTGEHKSGEDASKRLPRFLIVNADDFGLSPGVNAGILRAHREGILTSATLLANGDAFVDAVRLAAEAPGPGVGLHLNIVRGRPVSPPESVPLLADSAGNFRPFRVRRMTAAFLAQAEREYRAQFEKVLAAGISPTHVDFEKHHAWQLPLYALAARLAEEYGAGGIRNLAEPVWFSLRRLSVPGGKRLLMSAALRSAFAFGGGRAETSLFRPAYFFGQLQIGRVTEESLIRLFRHLPEGVSEVMTHPGLPDGSACGRAAARPGWLSASDRAAELGALVSPAVRAAAAACGAALVSYPRASATA